MSYTSREIQKPREIVKNPQKVQLKRKKRLRDRKKSIEKKNQDGLASSDFSIIFNFQTGVRTLIYVHRFAKEAGT